MPLANSTAPSRFGSSAANAPIASATVIESEPLHAPSLFNNAAVNEIDNERTAMAPAPKSRTVVDFDSCRNDVMRAAVAKVLSGKSTTIKQCLLHVGFTTQQASNRTMQMRVRRQVQKMVRDLQQEGANEDHPSPTAMMLAGLQQTAVPAQVSDTSSPEHSQQQQPAPTGPLYSVWPSAVPCSQVQVPAWRTLSSSSDDEISVLTSSSSGLFARPLMPSMVAFNERVPSIPETVGTIESPEFAFGSFDINSLPEAHAVPVTSLHPDLAHVVPMQTDEKSPVVYHYEPLSKDDSIPSIPLLAELAHDESAGFTGTTTDLMDSDCDPFAPLTSQEEAFGEDFDFAFSEEMLRDLQNLHTPTTSYETVSAHPIL